MVWCPYCGADRETVLQHGDGTTNICCTGCGKIHFSDIFTEEPTFVKGLGGESRVAGSLVRSIACDCSESCKRSIDKGKSHINYLATKLDIREDTENQASNFYKIAVERSFTKGRRTAEVAAACLYIACRVNKKPYLLIDFSCWLSINVYVLGAVYLQLCKLLSLEEYPSFQKLVDPSLFMDRFTSALLKDQNMKVTATAMHIVASMKRDWMQTGRKPSGICGAAIYISALAHGFRFQKSEIVKVVRICEATLTKRLIEFENTESASLTIEEFNKNAKKFEEEIHSCKLSDKNPEESGTTEVLCGHKEEKPHLHGLCSSCYKYFIEFSGGLHCGSEPPAFQRAEMGRLAKSSAEKAVESSSLLKPHRVKNSCENGKELDTVTEANQIVIENEKEDSTESLIALAANGNPDMVNDDFDTFQKLPTTADETDSLSDIDDVEVNGYLNNEEECRYKKIIWEEMNKEYLQEQAAKEAAAAAACNNVSEASDDLHAAHELTAAAAAAVAKSRETRRRKRAFDTKNASPAQTAAEATRQMLTKKRLTSKINYDVLDKLFDDNLSPNMIENRVESNLDSKDTGQQLNEEKNEVDAMTSIDEEEQDMEEDVAKGAHGNQWYDENKEAAYDYDYDGYDEFDVD